DALALDDETGVGGIDVGQYLGGDRLLERDRAVHLGQRARDLALVPVEDAQGDADAEAERVVGPDPLVLGLRRHVPPRVRARQVHVGLGLGVGGGRRAQVGTGLQRA